MLSNRCSASLSIATASCANIISSRRFSKSIFLGQKKISYLSNSNPRFIKWNNNFKMDASNSSSRNFTVKASAQPLKNADELIDSVETFIFDCDGVIWKGDSLIDGVPETLDLLRAKGKRLVFVTNNSTKSRKQYGKKFESLGLSVSEEEIFASSFAAAAYLQSINFPKDKKTVIPSCTERKIADTYIKSFDRAVDLLFLLESQSVLDSNEEMEESYMEVQKSLFSPMNICPQSQRSSNNEDCQILGFDSPFNRRWVEDSDTEPTPLDELPIDTYLEVLKSLNSPMNLCLKSQASPIRGNQQNLGFDFLSSHPNTEPNTLKQLPFDDFENNDKQQAYGAHRFLDQYLSPSLHCSPQGFKTSNEGWQASCC